jgi:hypothetical protein
MCGGTAWAEVPPRTLPLRASTWACARVAGVVLAGVPLVWFLANPTTAQRWAWSIVEGPAPADAPAAATPAATASRASGAAPTALPSTVPPTRIDVTAPTPTRTATEALVTEAAVSPIARALASPTAIAPPTAMPTPSFTATATSSPSATPTATATPTMTPTMTPSMTATMTPTSSPVPVTAETLRRLEEAVVDALGASNRPDVGRVRVVQARGRPEGLQLFVDWAINRGNTPWLTRTGAQIDVLRILRAIQGAGMVGDELAVQGSYAVLDEDGTSQETIVVVARYAREAVMETNWDRVSYDGVASRAEQFWLHEALGR